MQTNLAHMIRTVLSKIEHGYVCCLFVGQLQQVKAGFQTGSELTQGDRLAEAIFELGTIAPRVLTQVCKSRPSVLG
jgi:hypothetical protein